MSKTARLIKKLAKEKSLRFQCMNRTEFAMKLNDIDTNYFAAQHLKFFGLSAAGTQLRGDL